MARKALGVGFHDGCERERRATPAWRKRVRGFEVSRVPPPGPCICFHSPLQ